MKLSHYVNWEVKFSKDTLESGQNLRRLGKAKKLTHENDGDTLIFSAIVRTDRNYRTEVTLPPEIDDLGLRCSCGREDCEHLAATMYLIEDYFSKIPDEQSDASAVAVRKNEPEISEGLEALIKSDAEEKAGQEEDSETASLYGKDGYRYFMPEKFEPGLNISRNLRRKAEALADGDFFEKPDFYTGFAEDADKGMLLRAKAGVYSGWWDTEVLVDRDHVLSTKCSNWQCRTKPDDKSYLGHTLCVHEVALLIMTERYLMRNPEIGDDTNYAALQLLRNLDNAPAAESEENEGQQLTRHTIVPSLKADTDDERLWVSFRFGNSDGKLYKVKNLPEFAEKTKKRELHVFSKRYTAVLSRESLDDAGHTWFDFISDVLSEEDMHAENYPGATYYSYESYSSYYKMKFTDSIPLFGSWLDRFFEILLESKASVEYEEAARYGKLQGKRQVRASEEYFKPELSIQPYRDEDGRFSGVTVEGKMPFAFPGQKYAYCIDESRIRRVDRKSYDAVSPLATSSGVISARVGRSHLGDFYQKALPQLKDAVEVTETGRDEIVRYLPPEADFTFYFDVLYGTVLGRVRVAYGDDVYDPADLITGAPVKKGRDEEKEKKMIDLVLSYIPTYDPQKKVFFTADEDNIYSLVSVGVDRMLQYGEVRTTDRFRRLGVKKNISVNVGVSLESNLLDLKVTSTDVSEEELLQILLSYQMHKKYYRLKDGSFYQLGRDTDGTIAHLSEMMDALQMSPKEFVKGKMHIPAYRALYIDRMIEDMGDVYADRDTHFKSLIRNFRTVSDADDEVPESLRRTLRRYQVTGYRWLRMLDRGGFGGILADDMGLGKTLQVIAVLLAERESGKADAISIVVCPASLVYNWEAEIHRFAPELAVRTVTGTQGERRKLLAWVENRQKEKNADEAGVCPGRTVSFAALQDKTARAADAAARSDQAVKWGSKISDGSGQDSGSPADETGITITKIRKPVPADKSAGDGEAELPSVLVTSYDLLKRDIDAYDGIHFRYAVIDEAQYIKNSRTAAAKSVKLLRAETRFALTGTPIENRLSELWSIFDFLMPGFLYSYEAFRTKFEQPIVKFEDKEAEKQLSRMVTPFVLRRLKKDVLKDLPDKIEEVRYVGLEKDQQKLYDAEVTLLRKKLEKESDDDFRKGKIEILSELTRIRQICCDPSLYFESYTGSSAKREACMDLLRSAADGGHKALVFSQFTSMLALLEKDLEAEKIPYYKITGSTPKEKRTEMAAAFNENDVPVFLISLKAGGTGLNLTGADIVIHYDPWWNLAVQNQATDRAHRIGQTKVVNVYKLIARGTIEEKIVDMQEAKARLSDNILSSEGISSASISRDELLDLLG